jgi:hypothetical protein
MQELTQHVSNKTSLDRNVYMNSAGAHQTSWNGFKSQDFSDCYFVIRSFVVMLQVRCMCFWWGVEHDISRL